MCKPTTWVVVGNGGKLTFGFKCKTHGIFTRRYSTRELRDQRLTEHKKGAK